MTWGHFYHFQAPIQGLQHKVMLKLKSMTENKENDNFMMFLCKRPEVWPRWEFMDEKATPAIWS